MKKEKEAGEKGVNENTNLLPTGINAEEDIAPEAQTPELEEIKYQEKYHFTLKRTVFILLNFCCLFATQLSWKYLQDEDDVESINHT